MIPHSERSEGHGAHAKVHFLWNRGDSAKGHGAQLVSEIKQLWPLDSGITGLSEHQFSLAVGEAARIAEIWDLLRTRLAGSEGLLRFTDQLTREWAIETGVIENLYELDRGVTQTLIERGFLSELLFHGSTNKPREYVIQLLKDQQATLEGLFDFVSQRRPLTVSYIKELHAALCRSQADVDAIDEHGRPMKVDLIRGDYKKLPNYPEREGVKYMYCPPEQVASEMERLVGLHEEHLRAGVAPEVEAAWLHHRFSIIHPFQDGNGRVARALSSLIFIQKGLFPVVVTRDDKAEYLAALEAADEGSLDRLIQLFLKLQRVQFRKAASISEKILGHGSGYQDALQGLIEKVANKDAAKNADAQRVFEHAASLEAAARQKLEELGRQIQPVLASIEEASTCAVDQSDPATDHFFRSQIQELSRRHLNYFADTGPYRSWVRLQLAWNRRAQLVVAFHSTGARFVGVLVAAPFLEFIDEEGGVPIRSSLVNLAKEPFEFYENEEAGQVMTRFEEWLDGVLAAMLAEFQQNL